MPPTIAHWVILLTPSFHEKNEFEISQFLLTSLYILREVCAPNNCALVPGEEVCRDESRMQMQNVPEEDCDLQPEETCHMEAVLVPRCVPIYFRPVEHLGEGWDLFDQTFSYIYQDT